MSNQIVEIDGAFGSGGGQILRTACALSAITKKPCYVFNIRQNRPKGGGLGIQHLKGLEAIAELCNGRLENATVGSKEIWFYPSRIQSKDLHIKIETAGSITLVLQTLILPALFAHSTSSGQASHPVKIIFDGGATDTFFSPTIDHFRYVFLKILEKMGPKVEINILRRGYYPEGGAKVIALITRAAAKGEEEDLSSSPRPWQINSIRLKSFNLIERGNLKKILVISGAANALKEKKVAERQIAGVREVLGKLKLPIEERIEYYDTRCPGSQICLVAEFENTVIGTDNLGKLGKRAEDVGREAALELLKEQKSNACLDKHLADQILPYMALTKEKSQVTVSEITNHCQTNIWVIEKFLEGEFEINPHTNFGVGVKANLISWVPKI